MIKIKVKQLIEETQAPIFDLVRHAAIAQGTAYRLAENRAEAISFDVLDNLCEYFETKLNRPIGVADILEREGCERL